ncbi:MAG: apolipoprotein N-acyltransferase [Gemmatimonadetes bacterium]|nr:apolipoprotein N-acyltransferase [Gemmatimonadota bacterium]
MSGRRAAALVVLGAVLLTASYPPFRLPPLSFIAVAPAVLLIAQATADADPRRAFRWGFWYGLAVNGFVLYWLVVALWHFTSLSALGYLATVLILAVFTGALFWFVVRVRLRVPAAPLWMVFPVVWTALEWMIGHLGEVRFPWLGLGTSLADAPGLVQWADTAGARGVTLWLAWCNVLLVDGWAGGPSDRVWRPLVLRRLVPVAVTILLAAGYGMWRMRTLELRELGVVGMVQPNEGSREKWDPAHADSVVEKLVALSRRVRALARPDLIIWPEAAIPGYVQMQEGWDRAIAAFAREGHTPVVAGGLFAEFHDGRNYDYFNAAFLYDSTGEWRRYPVYAKRYLVPIVERVPFVPPQWFGNLRFFGGFSHGRELPVYAVGIGRFGVVVCYESAFEELARRYRRLGADFLVNVTNDKWYGRTAGPYQHATHLVMRAIETRMGVARAANSGITEFLDPLGRRYESTELETQTVVAGRLRTSDVIPPYARWGDWVGTLVVLTTLGFAGAMAVLRWRRST